MGSSSPNTTEREYGRRLYVSDLTYQGQIRKPTDKAFDDLYKLPHSENKKPYMEDDYGEMEYFQSPPFGFPWDFPDFDAPWQMPGKPPWLLIFTCQVLGSPCFCADGTAKCYSINCSHKIVEATIEPLGDPGDVGLFSVTASGGQICIAGKVGAEGAVRVNILMQAEPGDGSIVYGEYGPIVMYQCDDEDCDPCVTATPVEYDSDSSPALIYQTDTFTVYVTPGTGPYSWVISGTGLTLGSAITAGISNTVTADGSACGCGAITVTDACGNVAYGGIRVVEASGWSGAYGMEEVTWGTCNIGWGQTSVLETCDNHCYAHKRQRGGGSIAGCAEENCRCADYLIEHSNEIAGCRYNCTWQPGARSLQFCRISLYGWICD